MKILSILFPLFVIGFVSILIFTSYDLQSKQKNNFMNFKNHIMEICSPDNGTFEETRYAYEPVKLAGTSNTLVFCINKKNIITRTLIVDINKYK